MTASALVGSNVHPHNRFFFSDGSLYLLVENSLYCVHRFLFEIHASMFPVHELETSWNKPYILGDVKKSDFDHLLASLYPRTLWVEETETTQDWVSVLGLASKWGFESLRSRAISKLKQTLDSPVDMVTLGHQYGIPDILLPGYAALCQSTVPLLYEEGLRLGMEAVLKIYRIRLELSSSGITPVPLEIAFAKAKEAGLGDERPRQNLDSEQASIWTDVGSVAAPQTSAEKEERGSVTLTPNVDSPPLVASTDAATLVSERPEQQHIDGHSPSGEPTSVALGNEGSESVREGLNFIEELIYNNSYPVSIEVIHWANTKDIQTLRHITQLIVEKAIEASKDEYNPYHGLCTALAKYTQIWHQITRLVLEKAMEEPGQSGAYVQLCRVMTDHTSNAAVTADGLTFIKYLDERCRENLQVIVASVAGAGGHMARIRRLRLVRFIGLLWNATGSIILDGWMAAFLDADDEEKVATLCMLMTHAGSNTFDPNGWLQRVKDVARETRNPRVRKLLQSMKVTNCSWTVANPDEDCTMQ